MLITNINFDSDRHKYMQHKKVIILFFNLQYHNSSAHMEARRYLELQIAEKFTDSYGVAQLYVGREWIFPGLSSWPIVHDAPYKAPLDRAIMAIIEVNM